MSWSPVAPDDLPALVAGRVLSHPGVDRLGIVRVAIDGAPAADPSSLAAALVPLLERAGRPVALVQASTFWRDASLRLEYGREDVESYLNGWLDAGALQREVLSPVVSGSYLPSLRDPLTNRSTREPRRSLGAGGVLIVSGALLLGRSLPFELAVHLHLSAGALARRTPPDEAWTLPAYREYDEAVAPVGSAELVVKVDDPRHPAVLAR